jgi:hypothetical protein
MCTLILQAAFRWRSDERHVDVLADEMDHEEPQCGLQELCVRYVESARGEL